jgi:adenosylcobinamide-GDP ribazoletransferase
MALAVGAILWVAGHFGLPPLAAGLLSVGGLALGTRAFHLDGLADTADGLTASYDRERSLAVMKSGSVGPAGAAAIVVVLGLQVVGFADLVATPLGAVILVCLSRGVLVLTCLRGVPAAEGGGLRTPFVGCVPTVVAVGYWVGVCALGALVLGALDLPWRHVLAGFGVATLVVALLLRRAIARLGGVTGDIFGASIEVTLAALLIAL